MKERISVLGCGWLGLPLAASFVEQGYQVNGSVRTASKIKGLEAKGIVPFIVDLETLASSEKAFFESDILVVAVPSKDFSAFQALIQMIEGSSVQKVIFISSTSVYAAANQKVAESASGALLVPEHPLLQIESLFMGSDAFECTVLRLAGLVGPGRHPGRFFKRGRKLSQPNGFVNLIHLQDCIALVSAVVQQSAWGSIFNGCATEHPSRRDFYTRALSDLGAPSPLEAAGEELLFKIVDNAEASKILKVSFLHSRLNAPDFFQSCT